MIKSFYRRHKHLTWITGAVAVLVSICLTWIAVELKWIHDRHAFRVAELASPDSGHGLQLDEAREIIAEGWPSAYHTKAPGALGLFGEYGLESLYISIPRSRLHRSSDNTFFVGASDHKVLQARHLFPESDVRVYSWNPADSRSDDVVIKD